MARSFIRAIVTGIPKTQAKLRRGKAKSQKLLKAALFQEGEKIMAASLEIVPVATGVLLASGHVQKPQKAFGTVFVELGYGGAAAPYALAVHENPRAGKTGGVSPQGIPYRRNKQGQPTWSHHAKGQWKYLEQPFNVAKVGLRERIQAFIRVGMKATR